MQSSVSSGFEVDYSASGKKWQMRSGDENLARAFIQQHHVSDSLARIMSARNILLSEAADFLEPKLRNLMPDPSLLSDMDKAAMRIADAIISGTKIAIFGDYDVDGATSSALILRYLRTLDIEARVYIPDRQREGYGPSIAAMDIFASEGVGLVITVDCGTMAHDALEHARTVGMDVIVADHHQSGVDLPPAYAVVNPRRLDDTSEMDYLAAVGVCFLLLVAVQRCLRQGGYFAEHAAPDLLTWLDIVAIGTVCDVVPLIGLNRALVRQGLQMMAHSQNIGLQALINVSRLHLPLGAYELGFMLGPRINAGGRVGVADIGVRLLTTQSNEEAQMLALRLDEYNAARKDIELRVFSEAQAQAETVCAMQNRPPSALVLDGRGWHSGVIGIVASRIKDMFHAPCFVIAVDDAGQAKGSARSLAGIDIGKLVARAVAENIIDGGGGHAMAAGISLRESQIAPFREWLLHALTDVHSSDRDTLWLDAAIAPRGASRDFVDDIAQLGPFGAGNAEPRFVLPHVRILNAQMLDAGHVRCVIGGEGGGRLKAMGFASLDANIRSLLTSRAPCHIAGYLRPDDWQGRRDSQLIIHDVSAT